MLLSFLVKHFSFIVIQCALFLSFLCININRFLFCRKINIYYWLMINVLIWQFGITQTLEPIFDHSCKLFYVVLWYQRAHNTISITSFTVLFCKFCLVWVVSLYTTDNKINSTRCRNVNLFMFFCGFIIFKG